MTMLMHNLMKISKINSFLLEHGYKKTKIEEWDTLSIDVFGKELCMKMFKVNL